MRLAFLGSPPFATPVFARLLASPHETAVLVTRPDRPRGRGRAVQASALVELACEHDVPVLQPTTTKDPEFVRDLTGYEPDVLLVASYGEILRTEVLELAPHGALNVHGSILPRHRGAAPIQRAILDGDGETGVTIQRMVLALDEGDVLLTKTTPIGPEDTSGDLFERLAVLGGEAAVEALDAIEAGTATFTAQDPDLATYAKKLGKDDGRIDWALATDHLERFVRAMSPWPGARTRTSTGRELVLIATRPAEREARDAAPGQVLEADRRLVVATGDGALEIVRLKPAGKGAMNAADFLRGAHLATGETFGDEQEGGS